MLILPGTMKCHCLLSFLATINALRGAPRDASASSDLSPETFKREAAEDRDHSIPVQRGSASRDGESSPIKVCRYLVERTTIVVTVDRGSITVTTRCMDGAEQSIRAVRFRDYVSAPTLPRRSFNSQASCSSGCSIFHVGQIGAEQSLVPHLSIL